MMNKDTSAKTTKKASESLHKSAHKDVKDEDVEIEVDEYEFSKPAPNHNCGCGCGSHNAHY